MVIGGELTPISLAPLPHRPLVSVLVANYNYADYLGRSILSVLNQTYEHFELIVCDDGSTDGSRDVISKFAQRDSRVKLVTKSNGGMASAWNAAHAVSAGQIYCPLDADDSFSPKKLEEVVLCFMRAPNSGLVVHPMVVVDPWDREVDVMPRDRRFEEGWIAPRVISRGGRWRFMITSGLCFRAELSRYLFPIPETTFRAHADALVFTLSPLLTEVSSVNEPLSFYRVHGGNNLGALVPTTRTDRTLIDLVTRTVTGVNTKLSELGLSENRLDLNRNLEYLQADLRISLFEGAPRRELFRKYGSVVEALLADDIYSPLHKSAGLLVYALAIVLPKRARWKWWTKVKKGQYFAARTRSRLTSIRASSRAAPGQHAS